MLKNKTWLALLLLVTIFLPLGASAQVVDEVFVQNSDGMHLRLHKLGRGVTNLVTGWLEVPRHIAKRWREYGEPITGTIVGGCEGVGWGFLRTVNGAYEIVTFPIEVPRDFRPLMEPEFILPEIWGDTIPYMDPVTSLEPPRPY